MEAKVAIIIPAYNEELTIQRTIESFYNEYPKSLIVVVNNNSKDKTFELANQKIIELGANGLVLNEYRQGKGYAIRNAFHQIQADIYIMVDGDCTYPASQIHELMKPILEGRADMVTGDRHSNGNYKCENKRLLHNFGNKLVQQLVNKLFNASLVDIMSGYRCFNKIFVKSYPIMVKGFEIETDMTLHALDKRFRIIEIPVDYKDRPSGSFSKLNTFSDGVRVIITIIQILRFYKPMGFFGWLGFLVLIVGLITSAPVINDWLKYQYVYHVPLAILATGLEIVALLMISIGLILDSIVCEDKRNFEIRLLNSPLNK